MPALLREVKKGRIRCEVIGCWRSDAASKWPVGTRIICRKCMRKTNFRTRWLMRAYKRRFKKFGDHADLEKAWDKWDQCLKQANDRTVGIS